MAAPMGSQRRLTRLLSGYLCGTHSGLPAIGRAGRHGAPPEQIAAAHRGFEPNVGRSEPIALGEASWRPEGEEASLAERLRSALASPGIAGLILFGSQARGGLTGFSDVDAVLVIHDEVADDPAALRGLRSHVLDAQRAVLAYQPMQHHGFEVVTPKLLRRASEALALPAPALEVTRSLTGVSVAAAVDERNGGRAALLELARSAGAARSWPRHPWRAHALVAMFELLPVLYLQSLGVSVPKWRSFGEARRDFGRSWWPFDVLAEVRAVWPRSRRAGLATGAALARNPWTAVAAWRRLPAPLPEPVEPLLTRRCLEALQALSRRMAEEAA